VTKVGWSKREKEKRLGNRAYGSGSEMLRACDIYRSWGNRGLYYACFGINYEIAVLQALRDRLRCKEIWVVGADRYRNPDEDLPSDFETKREPFYEALGQPRDVAAFVAGLQKSLRDSLDLFERDLPRNRDVKIIERGKARLSVSPWNPSPNRSTSRR
jgi:hypothetical protein